MENSIILMHTDKLFEAETIVAALEDAGMPAYCEPTKSKGTLAFPSAMGLSEHGYDVCVLESKLEEAKELLKGITVNEETQEIDGEEAEYPSDNTDDPQPDAEYVVPPESVEAKRDTMSESKGKSLLFTLGALIIIMLFVWLSDALIEWVKGLMGCM